MIGYSVLIGNPHLARLIDEHGNDQSIPMPVSAIRKLLEAKMSASKEEARERAIEWQYWASTTALSYGELVEWQSVFEELADKYDLREEFVENGIL